MADPVNLTKIFITPTLDPVEPPPAQDLAELSLAAPAGPAPAPDLADLNSRVSGVFGAFATSIRPPLPLPGTNEPAAEAELPMLLPLIPTRQASGSWLAALLDAPETARSLGHRSAGSVGSPMGSPIKPARQSSERSHRSLPRAPQRPVRPQAYAGTQSPLGSPLRPSRQESGNALDLFTLMPPDLLTQISGDKPEPAMGSPAGPLPKPSPLGFASLLAFPPSPEHHHPSKNKSNPAMGSPAGPVPKPSPFPPSPLLRQLSGNEPGLFIGSPLRLSRQSSGDESVLVTKSQDPSGKPPEPPAPGFVTPVTTPARKPPIRTPEEVRAFKEKIDQITPDRPLNPRERPDFKACIDALSRVEDTPERHARADHTRRVMEEVFTTAVPKIGALYPPQDDAAPSQEPDAEWDPYADEDSGEQKGAPLHIHRGPSGRRCVGLRDSQIDVFAESWPKRALDQLRGVYLGCTHRPPQDNLCLLVNLEHALRPTLASKVAVGFHLLCPENAQYEREYRLRRVGINPLTGVWAGEYRLPGSKGPKISTFFPLAIDSSEKLLDILSAGEIIAQEENRRLMHIPGQRFHVELYLRGSLIWSCFPTLFYAAFDGDASYQITDRIVLDAANVLAYGQAAAKANGIMYELENDLIIDIAKQIPGCPVSSGVYIVFPKDLI